jgi:sugar phosphate permease
VLGGFIDQRHGWRTAFFVAGGPGLALALLCLLLRDPPRGGEDAAPAEAPLGAAPAATADAPLPGALGPVARLRPSIAAATRTTYVGLAHNRPYVLTVLGYAAYTFAVGGLAAWMPAFLERVRGISSGEAAIGFGKIVVVTGLVGTFAGGWIADYCRRYSREAFLWLSAVSTLLAAPFVWAALTTASHAEYLVYMIAAQLLMFLSTGPVNAAIVNLVAPTERASAVALSVFTIHILGDVLSPSLIGVLSDATSLGAAVEIVPVAVIGAGILWTAAARAAARSHAAPAAGLPRAP